MTRPRALASGAPGGILPFMLAKLKSLFAPAAGPARMSDLRPEEPVAVCAILLEVAEADRDFAPEERETIVALLGEHFGLERGEVEALIDFTRAERARTPDLWPFTNAIARAYGEPEKLRLLEMVWQVIFADQRLDAHEDHLARRLQGMLSVNHSVLIEAKQRARAAASRG